MTTNTPTIADLKLIPQGTAVFGWYFEMGVTLRYIYENRRRLGLSTNDIERLVNTIHGNVIQLSQKYSGGSMPYINMKVQWDQTKKNPLPWMWRLVYKEVHAQEVRLRQARQAQLQQTVRAVSALKMWPLVQLQAELQQVLAADVAEDQAIDAAASKENKEHRPAEQREEDTEEREESQEDDQDEIGQESQEDSQDESQEEEDEDGNTFYRRGVDPSPRDGMGAWNVAGEHHPYAYDDGTADEDWDPSDPDAYLYAGNATRSRTSRPAAMIDLTADQDDQPDIDRAAATQDRRSNRPPSRPASHYVPQHITPSAQQTVGSAWGMVQPYQPSSRQPSQLQPPQNPRAYMQQTAPQMQQYSASNTQQAPNWVNQYILGNTFSDPNNSVTQAPGPRDTHFGQYGGSQQDQNGSNSHGYGSGGYGQFGYR